jgi:methane monooxygenase component A beta chain/propane monooxygenase small subunit
MALLSYGFTVDRRTRVPYDSWTKECSLTTPTLAGYRQFVWFKPAGRRPTQYEAYTVGQQSSPEQWLHVDWPLRFDDGRAPYIAESTALRAQWSDYRDPTQTWQRPYVAQHNQQEQTIGTLVPEALRESLYESIVPAWREKVLGTYYAAWPFVENGEFRCLCYAVREALSDTLTFSLAFTASDKLRHSQDIVYYLLTLKELDPPFSDDGARAAWMTDPTLLPLRETIERIHSLTDWAEIAVAIHLVLEPLAGELFKTEFLAKLAPLNGDSVTSMILASARQDSRRHLASTQALVGLALADPTHGAANRALVGEWIHKWTPRAAAAARALGTLFELDGIVSVSAAPQIERAFARHRSIIAGLGFEPGKQP